MAQMLRFQGKSSIDGSWYNLTVTVHNRTELLEFVEKVQSAEYVTFGLYQDNGSTLLECSPTRTYWHKTVGFRP